MTEIGVRIQKKGQVTIPQRIRDKLNLAPGDLVVFVETEAGVMVKPASVVVEDDRRDEVRAIVDSIRERFTEYSAEEVESLVNDAVREVRESRE